MQEDVYVMFVILNVVKNLLLLFGIHEILRFAQEDKVIYFEVEIEIERVEIEVDKENKIDYKTLSTLILTLNHPIPLILAQSTPIYACSTISE